MSLPPSPKQLATHLRDLADKLDTNGGRALEMAEALAARGYPASTAGNGSRSSDTTSSTERAALAGADKWAGIDVELASVLFNQWVASRGTETTISRILAHGTTNDPLPPGTGECTCGANCARDRKSPTFCAPRRNGPSDRLVSGLAPTCYRRYARWRELNPAGTVADWKHTTRRAREIAEARAAQLAAGRCALRG